MSHAVDCLLERWTNEKRLVKYHKIVYLTISGSELCRCRYFSHVSTSRLWNGSLIAFTCGRLERFEELRAHTLKALAMGSRKNQELRISLCEKEFFWIRTSRTPLPSKRPRSCDYNIHCLIILYLIYSLRGNQWFRNGHSCSRKEKNC